MYIDEAHTALDIFHSEETKIPTSENTKKIRLIKTLGHCHNRLLSSLSNKDFKNAIPSEKLCRCV